MVVVVGRFIGREFAGLFLDLASQPFQFTHEPLVVFAVEFCVSCRGHEADGAGVVFHAWCAGHAHGFVERGQGLAVLAVKVLQFADGGHPHGGRLRLAAVHYVLGVADEVVDLVLQHHAHVEHLFHPLLVALAVEGFLGVVHEVLHQEVHRRRIGVLVVDGLDAAQVAHLAHGPLDAHHVALLGVDVAGFRALALPQQGTGIDVLHHVTVDAGGQFRPSLCPESDVVGMVAQHHVGAHTQQLPLGFQPRALVGVGLGDDAVEVDAPLLQFGLRGVVPGFLQLVADVEISVQAVQVAHHLRIAFFLGGSHDFVFRPLVGAHLAAGIVFPELVGAFGEEIVAQHLATEDAEHVVVVLVPLAAAAPCTGHYSEQEEAKDGKSSHNVVV